MQRKEDRNSGRRIRRERERACVRGWMEEGWRDNNEK